MIEHDRVRTTWKIVRWPLLVALAVASFVLGMVGWRQWVDAADLDRSTLDVVYLTLQLYTLESGSVPEDNVPLALEIARLAAPAFSATALVTAIAVAFRQQIADWRLGRQRGHVVVSGIGSQGTALAIDLLDHGHSVVAIDTDGSSASLESLRRRGALVVVGDPGDPETLHRAHLDRADHLISLASSDETNAETVLNAAQLSTDRTGQALSCLAHIRDAGLCVLMRSEELASAHRSGLRVDYFNLDEQGARAMIRDHSPFPDDDDDDGSPPPHVLVLGLNPLGQSLVTELARSRRSLTATATGPMRITAVDPDADSICARLHRDYPLLADAASVEPVVSEIDPPDVELVPATGLTAAYVCIDDDSLALKAALAVRNRMTDPQAMVVVEMGEATGLARLVERPVGSRRIRAFSVLDRTLRADLILGGTNELLARVIHEDYIAEQRREGATLATNPSMAPWDELPKALRESNRDQAAHIGTKLAAVGRGIAPLADWNADSLVFTGVEIEELAEMEHERWVRQRVRDGWTAGPKDVERRTTPHLVPWADLTNEVKEWDRQAVQGIPSFLARAGYQAVARGADND